MSKALKALLRLKQRNAALYPARLRHARRWFFLWLR